MGDTYQTIYLSNQHKGNEVASKIHSFVGGNKVHSFVGCNVVLCCKTRFIGVASGGLIEKN